VIQARIVALWRGYIRFLRTDQERVGTAERCLRGLLVVVPYYAIALLLLIRATLWRPLTVEHTTDDGLRFRAQLPDGVQTFVYLFGVWEPDLTAFLRRRLRPGDTFIDIGANVGYMSALASKLVGPRGSVVSIEPAPIAKAALQETFAMNDLANTRLVAAAVSDREDELPLFVGPSFLSLGRSTTVPRAAHGHPLLREHDRVHAAPLGSLVTREELATARLIKIDVEGAEDRVLAGLLASIDALAPEAEIFVEVEARSWSDPQLRPIDVLRPFLDRGFHVYQVSANYWPWRYLWSRRVSAPVRLRDLAVLERRGRLDIVLSRVDADAL
jgi:FkbM family methyltransferase